jgi:hypothetical protein
MANDPGLYCTLFVDAPLGPADMLCWVADQLGGEVDGLRDVTAPLALVGVLENDEFDPVADADRGFLYYRYRLEVDPAPAAPLPGYVGALAGLLRAADAAGWRFAASCDFEAELPQSSARRAGRAGPR